MGPVAVYRNRILKKIYEQKGVRPSVLRNLSVVEHIDNDMPVHEAEYVVFDTELTGLKLKKDSIVSIGAVKMSGGRIDMGDIFYRLVEPATELTGKSVVIHGITPSEVSGWPDIDVLLPEFIDFCGKGIIVGHFVSIDLSFVNREMRRMYGFPLQNPSLDTIVIHKWLKEKEEEICAYYGGNAEGNDLFSLARKYQVPVSQSHNALNDAFVTAQLFQRFIRFLPKFGTRTVGDLLRIGRPA